MKKRLFLSLCCLAVGIGLGRGVIYADNQTSTLTPVITDKKLPFRIEIRQTQFSLPNGIHSGVFAVHDGKWLFLAGRTNGLHGFNDDNNNFPPLEQNHTVYVVDRPHRKVYSRSLTDPRSELTQEEIDLLTVTSPQFYQSGKTLYMTGGYGVESDSGQFSTKDVLTAINVPKLMDWVMHRPDHVSVKKCIRQVAHENFRVTGGDMWQFGDSPTLLIFGQNFQGFYTDPSNGTYTKEVRRFRIEDDGEKLHVHFLEPKPEQNNENYRRRDLNVVPIVQDIDGKLQNSFVAYSGVFTESGGAWTVPVEISPTGKPHMSNPDHSTTFKQAMNNYVCPSVGLYSKKEKDMYTILFGGITYGYFQDGEFMTDSELPFTNEVTAIKIDQHHRYSQYLLPGYPKIISTQSNPGNQLLFGAGGYFVPADKLPAYENGVLRLDHLDEPVIIGYIVGGIMSTLPNTNSESDSTASPFIFEVRLKPRK